MNRGNARTMFYSFPIVQVVPAKTLNTEKNTLISIMASYIAKETDKEQALTDLTTLEVSLKTSTSHKGMSEELQ
jgi:hypothetical protein